MENGRKVAFFGCRKSIILAKNIAKSLNLKLGNSTFIPFSDGEFSISYDDSIRGATVFIIQSTFAPADNFLELCLMIDAAHRASAYKVVAVIPYFGWARQDRKDKPRVAIGAKMIANLLCATGVDRVMTMDLHADQIQGFFDVPVDHLYASSIFVPYIKSLNLENIAIAAPDMGGAKRANAYSRFLDASLIICHKNREKANQISEMTAIGDIEGKNVIILDDMIDTAGTVTKAADMMMANGALSVRVFATHAVLSGPAYERILNSRITELVVTDTIPLKKRKDTSKIIVLSAADLFADVLTGVINDTSIAPHFLDLK